MYLEVQKLNSDVRRFVANYDKLDIQLIDYSERTDYEDILYPPSWSKRDRLLEIRSYLVSFLWEGGYPPEAEIFFGEDFVCWSDEWWGYTNKGRPPFGKDLALTSQILAKSKFAPLRANKDLVKLYDNTDLVGYFFKQYPKGFR